jgi:post-segregation antitoxin (ccd killing protein)
MKRRKPRAADAIRRRTTLTLPADSLAQAERLARARQVNVSVVVSEALSDGLRMHAATERSEQVFNAYKKAFAGFSDEEMTVLDGVVLASPSKRQR